MVKVKKLVALGGLAAVLTVAVVGGAIYNNNTRSPISSQHVQQSAAPEMDISLDVLVQAIDPEDSKLLINVPWFSYPKIVGPPSHSASQEVPNRGLRIKINVSDKAYRMRRTALFSEALNSDWEVDGSFLNARFYPWSHFKSIVGNRITDYTQDKATLEFIVLNAPPSQNYTLRFTGAEIKFQDSNTIIYSEPISVVEYKISIEETAPGMTTRIRTQEKPDNVKGKVTFEPEYTLTILPEHHPELGIGEVVRNIIAPNRRWQDSLASLAWLKLYSGPEPFSLNDDTMYNLRADGKPESLVEKGRVDGLPDVTLHIGDKFNLPREWVKYNKAENSPGVERTDYYLIEEVKLPSYHVVITRQNPHHFGGHSIDLDSGASGFGFDKSSKPQTLHFRQTWQPRDQYKPTNTGMIKYAMLNHIPNSTIHNHHA